MGAGNSRVIPHFLSAGSPQSLRRKMLLNNIKYGRQFNYFAIQKDGKNWIAWFYNEAQVAEETQGSLAENVSGNA